MNVVFFWLLPKFWRRKNILPAWLYCCTLLYFIVVESGVRAWLTFSFFILISGLWGRILSGKTKTDEILKQKQVPEKEPRFWLDQAPMSFEGNRFCRFYRRNELGSTCCVGMEVDVGLDEQRNRMGTYSGAARLADACLFRLHFDLPGFWGYALSCSRYFWNVLFTAVLHTIRRVV